MGYWLEDVDGEWLGDLATNKGMSELRKVAGPALAKLLNNGESESVDEIVSETRNDEKLSYVAKMLEGVSGSVFVTDGCGFVEIEK